MQRNKFPDSSLPSGSIVVSIKSDSVCYVTLLIVMKLFFFKCIDSIYSPILPKLPLTYTKTFLFCNFHEGVLIFCNTTLYHFIITFNFLILIN